MIEIIVPAGLALFVYYIFSRKDPLDEMPGPKAYPVVGSALQLDSEQPHLSLYQMAAKYGGIYKLKLFSMPIVVVSDPQYIQAVLLKQTADFAGRPDFFRAQVFSDNQSGIVLVDAGPEYTGRKKVIQTFLKQFTSKSHRTEGLIQEATDELLKDIAEYNGKPMDVSEHICHCVANIIVILLRGEPVSNAEIKVLKPAIETIHEGMGASLSGIILDMFPFVRFFGNKAYEKMKFCYFLKDKFVMEWIKSRPNTGFINFFQEMSDEEQRSSFLDHPLFQRNTVYEFLMGGVFTSTETLSCLMNVLCHYQGVQEKLRKEVLDVVGPARHPLLSDRDKMPYHRATILEIGRYASILAGSVPHKTTTTTQLGQFTIPKDTQVWPNLWALHHDEKLWDEPFEFKPERFLDSDGEVFPLNHPNRQHLLPFSAGHRACPGEVFALQRMFLVVARLLQNFSILPESTVEEQPSCDPRNMRMGVGLAPPPFKVRMVQI